MLSRLNRFQRFGALVLRLVLGSIMFSYGYQQVAPTGALRHISGAVVHLGLPAWLGPAIALIELCGGALVFVGFLTRLAASFEAAIDLAVIAQKIHSHGLLAGSNVAEVQWTCFAIALMLIFTGPGMLALENLVRRRSPKPGAAPATVTPASAP